MTTPVSDSSVILEAPKWGPWLGVPEESRHVCAVRGCEREASPQICPFDGRYHHHGCIHYDRAPGRIPELEFLDGWGWVCDFHYGAICAATGHLDYIR